VKLPSVGTTKSAWVDNQRHGGGRRRGEQFGERTVAADPERQLRSRPIARLDPAVVPGRS